MPDRVLETAAFGLDRYRWLKADALSVCAVQRTCERPKPQKNLRGRPNKSGENGFIIDRSQRSARKPIESISRAATEYIVITSMITGYAGFAPVGPREA